jgi:myo-inositol-1(or 4)-monophosphatase
MTALDFEALLATAQRAANAGGEIVRKHFGGQHNVRAKGPGDWVSEVDLASETEIRALLTRESGLPVLGEEEGGADAELGWYVDPLDGTANFVHGFDAVGVSVGLVDDGVPIVGVVAAPLLDRTWTAVKGRGAFRDGRPIRVSERPPSRAIVATGFPFRHKDLLVRYGPMFDAAFGRFEDIRRVGAASLDLCWTAEGVFDGFFELRLGPWDVAAGALIVREAGGVVTDWEGDDGAWLRSGDVLAGTSAVHAELRELASSHP